jgi:hypothetical protein
MFRIFLFLIALVVGVLAIDPGWDRAQRTLHLRVRATDEIARFGRQIGTDFVARATSTLRRDGTAPAVASGPRDSEQLTEADRQRLDRLIEEKLRE